MTPLLYFGIFRDIASPDTFVLRSTSRALKSPQASRNVRQVWLIVMLNVFSARLSRFVSLVLSIAARSLCPLSELCFSPSFNGGSLISFCDLLVPCELSVTFYHSLIATARWSQHRFPCYFQFSWSGYFPPLQAWPSRVNTGSWRWCSSN